MSSKLISMSIDDISVGVSCRSPIVDEHYVLLVGEDTRITEQVISRLRSRGITRIMVDPRDLVLLKGGKRAKPKPAVDGRPSREAMLRRPLKAIMVDRFDESLSPDRGEVIRSNLSHAAQQIDLVRNQLCTESLRSVSALVELSDRHAETLVDDQDHVVGIMGGILGGNTDNESLSHRSARLATLGMAVAAEMGLSGQKTIEVGLTGLLHDIGLMMMDRSLSQPYDWMTEKEQWEYKKHPLVAAAFVERIMEVPHNVSLAITQLHEQYDGSGYPRGLQKDRIQRYARILNVVDSYLSLTAPSRYHPALIPHDALAFLLHQAAKGMFDPEAIRAFLKVESLFPLGSLVELSNGEAATVIRRPRSGYSLPVVTDSDGNRIELEHADVAIVRPIIGEGSESVRITHDLMKDIEWTPLTPIASEAVAR